MSGGCDQPFIKLWVSGGLGLPCAAAINRGLPLGGRNWAAIVERFGSVQGVWGPEIEPYPAQPNKKTSQNKIQSMLQPQRCEN